MCAGLGRRSRRRPAAYWRIVSSIRYRVPVAAISTVSIDLPKLVDDIQCLGRVPAVAYRGRLGKPEAAGEHRQLTEHLAFPGREQLIAPVDRRLQRLVTAPAGRPPVGQEPEPVGQVGLDLLYPQRGRPRRGELDRQRQPVQLRQIAATVPAGPGSRLTPPRAAETRSRNNRTAGARAATSASASSGGTARGGTW